MEIYVQSTTKISDIITLYPQTSHVLKQYRIDFCCGGNRPLQEAIEEKHLNQEEVLTQLNEAIRYSIAMKDKHIKWEEATYAEIIEHIIQKHHQFVNQVLPELSVYVTKVLRVHGAVHPEQQVIHRLFHQLKMEMEQHLIQEEEVVFPQITAYEQQPSYERLTKLLQTIDTLEKEHSAVGDLLKALREASNDYTLPPGACRTYTLSYHKLEEFESDTFEHVHLENNILFPRLARELEQTFQK